MRTPSSDVASPAELGLRAAIATRLDEARRRLENFPAVGPLAAPATGTEAARLIDVCAALLTEIVELNTRLADLDGLSTDGALGSHSVAVAVTAASETISALRAGPDHAAA